MGETDDRESLFNDTLEGGERRREGGSERRERWGEEMKEEEGGGATKCSMRLKEQEESSEMARWRTMCCPHSAAAGVASTADDRRTCPGLRTAGWVVVVLSLGVLAVLSAYLGLVATIAPPLITLNPSAVQNLLIDGPYLNAVVSFDGIVDNKSRFKVHIEDPAVHVSYHGAALGMVRGRKGGKGGKG